MGSQETMIMHLANVESMPRKNSTIYECLRRIDACTNTIRMTDFKWKLQVHTLIRLSDWGAQENLASVLNRSDISIALLDVVPYGL